MIFNIFVSPVYIFLENRFQVNFVSMDAEHFKSKPNLNLSKLFGTVYFVQNICVIMNDSYHWIWSLSFVARTPQVCEMTLKRKHGLDLPSSSCSTFTARLSTSFSAQEHKPNTLSYRLLSNSGRESQNQTQSQVATLKKTKNKKQKTKHRARIALGGGGGGWGVGCPKVDAYLWGALTSSRHRGEVEILCFQGEQNKQLQRNLNAPHVNFPPTVTCFCGD